MDFWWRPLGYLLGLAFFALIVYLASDPATGYAVLAAGLFVYLFIHLRQLARFQRWLNDPTQPVPEALGAWGEALSRLRKLMRLHADAEHKTSAELDQMLAATQSLPEGVVILDRQHCIQWLNTAAEQHLGLTPKRDIGQFISYLLRNSRFNEWLIGEDYTQPLTLAAPTAPDRILSLRMVPLSREQKMLLSHDITEIHRVEAMRRDFVANVSHELRTPITVIVGFLDTFAEMDTPDPKEFKKHIGLMREQSERIRRLIEDLLTLARLESDPEVRDEAVDVPGLMQRLLSEARTLSQGRHAIELCLDTDVRLLGSHQELYGAFANLVSNAVRYTPAGGHITLRWAEGGNGQAEFSVSDTGEGIEAAHIPRLTERFYRVDRGRSRATGGTGLGLAIVKHALNRHQARLRIESTVGKGSTFTACFPPERVIPALEPQTS